MVMITKTVMMSMIMMIHDDPNDHGDNENDDAVNDYDNE